MIAEGRVALNGVAIDTPATVLTSLHGVTVDGEPVKAATPARLFIFHKPPGVLTAAFDPKGRATIYDRLPKDLPRLMPVGRLDLNTEGLLLLTTDGELKRQLELPATGVERSYRARTYGQVSQAQLEELIEGVEIDGIRYGSIDANQERRTGANAWIELMLTEGKNREVRRVLEYLGLQVSRLIRTRYGPFVLGDLPVGGIGEVRQHDLIAFRQTLKLPKAQAAAAATARPIAVAGQPKPRPAPSTDAPRAAPRAAPARSGAKARPQRAEDARKPARAEDSRKQRPPRPSRKPEPTHGREERDELETRRPRGERPTRAAATPATAPKPKPKRGAGWAKPKIKPKPGKPRKPRA